MKLKIFGLQGKEKKEIDLPVQFSEETRSDIIKRAVQSLFSFKRQPYGTDPRAGKNAAATLSRKRKDYKSGYGSGRSRVPRKTLTRRGTQFYFVGAVAPGTRKGRRAHPPKAEKIREEKINKKERRKAIRSAIASTLDKNLVQKRGHILGNNYPFILSSEFESLKKTKEVKNALHSLDLEQEIERCNTRKIRAGKAKMRNRRYRTKKGPLIVVSNNCPLMKSARNILGIDVVNVKSLNVHYLAPGSALGRLTLWTEGAIDMLSKEQLYV